MRDAAVVQKERQLSLVVVVGYATNSARARQLGDNFARMVKTFGGVEAPPGREIGQGELDYLVTVVTPNEQVLAQGAKVSFSPHITW